MLKIIVLAKQVPDTHNVGPEAMTPEGTVNRAALPTVFNPEDLNALEQALRLKEQHPGSTITMLTMGLPKAADVLREGVYRGADDGILLTDRALGGADTLATSYSLAQAIRKIGNYDIILCGRQAIDGDTAQVGPQIAEHLDLPQVSYMEDLKYDEATKTFTIRKQLEDGYQLLEMQAPCVVTALASAVKPRYMTVGGIVTAWDKEVEVWGADRINVPEDRIGKTGSPTSVFKAFPKQLKPAGETFEVAPEEAVELIVNKLKEKHII